MRTLGFSMLALVAGMMTQTQAQAQAQHKTAACCYPTPAHCVPASNCAPNTCQEQGCQPACDAPVGCAPTFHSTDHTCCDDDCTPQFKKVCRIVCRTQRVKKIRWECVSKDICLPGKSKPVEDCPTVPCTGPGCQEDCCNKSDKKPFFSLFSSKKNTVPTCGKIRTVKKLIRVEYEVEVPVYHCEVITIPCHDECTNGNCAPSENTLPQSSPGYDHSSPPAAPTPVPKEAHPNPKASVDAAIFTPARLFRTSSIRQVSHSR